MEKVFLNNPNFIKMMKKTGLVDNLPKILDQINLPTSEDRQVVFISPGPRRAVKTE